MLRIWKCNKCGEEFWYNDDSIKEVFCNNGNKMKVVHKDNLSEHKKKTFTNKREKYLFFIFISMFIIMMGVTMNFLAVVENGGKMPVNMNYFYETDSHISYYSLGEVINYYYFTDFLIFDKLSNGNLYYSIGDVLMILAVIMLIGFTIVYLMLIRKDAKRFKENCYY